MPSRTFNGAQTFGKEVKSPKVMWTKSQGKMLNTTWNPGCQSDNDNDPNF